MTCRFSAENALAKATDVIERVKRAVVSSPIPPFIDIIYRGHSRASQCEIKAFWKKKPTRVEAYAEQRSQKGSLQLKSRRATEENKGETLQ
jgi:hypothetical protein